jgi:hypothetical protein
LLRINPVAHEIRNYLITKSASVDDALSRACHEIHWREMRMRELENKLETEERKVSAGYVRRHPEHRARKPKPQLADPVSDDWIKTGASGDAS